MLYEFECYLMKPEGLSKTTHSVIVNMDHVTVAHNYAKDCIAVKFNCGDHVYLKYKWTDFINLLKVKGPP